jgi:hypothetical protein
MVDAHARSQNLDPSAAVLSFRRYFRPLRAAVDFLIRAKPALDRGGLLPELARRLVCVLPVEGCRVARRVWERLSEADKTVVVRNGCASLDFTQDHDPPAVLCALVLATPPPVRAALAVCAAKLAGLARFALDRRESLSEKNLRIFEAFLSESGQRDDLLFLTRGITAGLTLALTQLRYGGRSFSTEEL